MNELTKRQEINLFFLFFNDFIAVIGLRQGAAIVS